jgi:hypothetical protein
LNREPPAKASTTAPFKPFRIDPLNRDPSAKTGATAPCAAGQFLSGSLVASSSPAMTLNPPPDPS